MKSSVYKLGRFLLWSAADEKYAVDAWPAGTETGEEIRKLSSLFKNKSSEYLMVLDTATDVVCDPLALRRLLTIAGETRAGMIYSDFLDNTNGNYIAHPLIDYQPGSIRDDFNFGHFFIISAAAINTALQKYGPLPHDPDIAFYDLRLKISIDHSLLHVPECLYVVSPKKQNPAIISGNATEAQFAYVAKENFARQSIFEKIATNHLKQIGAHLMARTRKAPDESATSDWTASVVIPVLNRKKTIAEALTSALGQKANFAFNVIVVDNHSTDGTTDILKAFAAEYPNVLHIIPSRYDLGIGGCWNEAIYSPHCGQYVIQLDSDDLYKTQRTLQKIVNTLRQGQYAMVVGSYTLVNEELKTIPPGLIDHGEWTQSNGHNNLLRVNGMGAPRAFSTAVLRQTGFPNVSYGEDYAVALRITRKYKIGRIYDSLYLCRRWTDNTDAALSVNKQNRNDYYKDKLRTMEIKARQLMNNKKRSGLIRHAPDWRTVSDTSLSPDQIFATFTGKEKITLPALCHTFFESQKKSWPSLASACRNLAATQVRELTCNNYRISLQYNPARIVSGSAAVDPESIRKRPCFLCTVNRPAEQHALLYRDDYLVLCNPAPIFNHHFTVVSLHHTPQKITSSVSALLQMAFDASPDYSVFYNGPACGASAPDHLHFQMIPSDALPFLRELTRLAPIKEDSCVRIAKGKALDRAVVVLESESAEALKKQLIHFLETTQKILSTNDEPPVNVFCAYEKNCWRLTLFLRRKHRPDAYFAEGENRIFVSPGAIDMAGVVIIPLLKDHERLDCKTLQNIYREISLDEETLAQILNGL